MSDRFMLHSIDKETGDDRKSLTILVALPSSQRPLLSRVETGR